MIPEKQVVQRASEFLEGSPLFLVDVVIRPTNKIAVYLDGDQGVTIEDCKHLSRHLEEKLDRETEDFDLTVSSPGADRPLKNPRQYSKNLGKELAIVTADGQKLTGKVLRADAAGIELSFIEKRSKKETGAKTISLPYTEIKSAKEVITFKK